MTKLLLSFLVLLTIGCSSGASDIPGNTTVMDSTPTRTPSVPVTVDLVAEKAVLDSTETPHASIKLRVNGEYVWQKEVLGNWNNFEKDQYQDYAIPASATSAYQSWWAGSGDIFYLIRENDKWLVRSCEIGESEGEEEVTYQYKTEKEVNAR